MKNVTFEWCLVYLDHTVTGAVLPCWRKLFLHG